MKTVLSIGEAALILGVSISTLRRWDENEQFKAKFRTIGGQRRYSLNDILNLISPEENDSRINILYSRVSSKGQSKDLEYQKKRLFAYSEEKNIPNILEISDLGSGINFLKESASTRKKKV